MDRGRSRGIRGYLGRIRRKIPTNGHDEESRCEENIEMHPSPLGDPQSRCFLNEFSFESICGYLLSDSG